MFQKFIEIQFSHSNWRRYWQLCKQVWSISKKESTNLRKELGKVVFSWTNLLNIWFLEPRFMEYKKYLSMWKLISDSCTLSLLYFFYRNCPLQVSTSATHLSRGWNWTGWKLQNQMLSFPQKHPGWPTVHPLFLSFGTHSSHLSTGRHQGEAEVPTRKP